MLKLLAVQSPDDNVHVPGKLFEYIGAGRPIFAVSRPCEVAEMIAKHGLGWVAEREAAVVATRLSEVYAAWKAKGNEGLAIHTGEQFNVRQSTQRLAEQLEAVCAAK